MEIPLSGTVVGDDVDLFGKDKTRALGRHCVDHELLCILKYSEIMCEANCLAA